MAKASPAGDPFIFEPKANEYSANNAYALVRCADLAYRNRFEVEKQIADWGFPVANLELYNKGETQGFAIANDETAIFSFRGTESKDDALSDANIKLTNGPFKALIHQGFAQALNDVTRFVDRTMRKYKRSGARSVWLTGHSLGAALATLAAAGMLEQNSPVAGMYTYGSPRVGDKAFVKALNAKLKNHYRMVYGEDVVTRIAPRGTGYAHAGQLTTIARNGNISQKGFTEVSFLGTVVHTLVALRNVDWSSLDDHKLSTGYLPTLQKRAVG